MHHRRAARSDGTSWAALGSLARVTVGAVAIFCLLAGAVAVSIGLTRSGAHTTTTARPWTITTSFGWTGTAAANDVYPDGQVQSPQPVFLRLLKQITVTADESSSGVTPGASVPLTLRATLGDGSGWSRTWALDRTVARAGGPAHLSAPLKLDTLFDEVAWNQIATGVQNPITLTLSVDREGASAPSAQLAFSLNQLLFKPLGPTTTTAAGTVSTVARAASVVQLAGYSVSVESLRRSGAVLLCVGLILAAAATFAGRNRRRDRRRQQGRASTVQVPAQIPGQRQAAAGVGIADELPAEIHRR